MPVRIAAAVVLAIEAVGVAALLVWQVIGLAAGDTGSVPSALALMVLTIIGAIAVGGFAAGTARDRSWGRSGGLVVQALILAVALGALTGEGADPLVAAAIATPGVIGAVLLILAVRAAAPRREEPPPDPDAPS